jgi:hypothetical protein
MKRTLLSAVTTMSCLVMGGVSVAHAQTIRLVNNSSDVSILCKLLPVCGPTGPTGPQTDDNGVINSHN